MRPYCTASVLILTILYASVHCDMRFCEPEDDDLSLIHDCSNDEALLMDGKVEFCEPKEIPTCAKYEKPHPHPRPPLLVNEPEPPPSPAQIYDEPNENIITKNEKWYRLFLKKNCGQEDCNDRNPSPKVGRKLRK